MAQPRAAVGELLALASVTEVAGCRVFLVRPTEAGAEQTAV